MQQLEKLLVDGVEKNTPDSIKKDKVFDYTNKDKFTFTLTRNLVEKLDLKKWFEGYKKEARKYPYLNGFIFDWSSWYELQFFIAFLSL